MTIFFGGSMHDEAMRTATILTCFRAAFFKFALAESKLRTTCSRGSIAFTSSICRTERNGMKIRK